MTAAITILLVEDDADARYVLSGRLMEGFPEARVIEAESAEEGLELVGRTPPSVVVLDLFLRGMDGFVFMQRAKEVADVPVIVLTGDTRAETRARALRAGAAAYLVKPEGLEELCRAVADALARPRQGHAP